MASPYLGEIRMFGGNFAPRGYALCDGTLLSIAQNDALFSLLGTTFGGDGVNTFGLPDLRGRVPLHTGQGPGQPVYTMGQLAGSETVTLVGNQVPAHTHPPFGSSAGGATNNPTGALPATTTSGNELYAPPGQTLVPLAANTIQPAGQSQPHENMMPFLTVTFIIALEGVYPTRN